MKKFLKFLIGFPVGIMFLLISYIGIYYIDGKETYLLELKKLEDIEFLVFQVLNIGLMYTVAFKAIGLFFTLNNDSFRNLTVKGCIKIFLIILIFGTIGVVADSLDVKGVMSGEVGVLTLGILFMIGIGSIIYFMIYNTMEECKINKALKEKNVIKK